MNRSADSSNASTDAVPEGLEAELYRRAACRAIGRPIASVFVDERQEMANEIPNAIVGASIVATRRIGKLLLLDLDDRARAAVLGVHFGMTGRLVVDDDAAITRLEYSSGRDDPAWDRFVVTFDDGGVLRVNDPRRWARYVLDPSEDRLGPDFLTIEPGQLIAALARRTIALKAALLDQSVVAGYGNMCVDEVLWQAGLSPLTSARDVPASAIDRLVATGREHLPAMLVRGGSHRGVIDPAVRADLPPCPLDGSSLRRDQVGGRTTVWCPAHQVAD